MRGAAHPDRNRVHSPGKTVGSGASRILEGVLRFFMRHRGGGVQDGNCQRPGIRQQRHPAFRVAVVPPLFFAEQVPPEA